MSATKEYFSQFFEQQHHDFITDTYEDFLRMQQEHEKTTIDDELVEQHEGAKANREINWTVQENNFFSKSPSTNDLPF
jgi:hypothetical protein